MVTYENQKTIHIHKDKCTKDFMQVQNQHIREAYRILNSSGMPVYIYLAGNSDGFDLALSRKAVMDEMSISKDTYHRGVKNLEDNEYLVHAHGNTYDFYTRPLWKIEEESQEDSRKIATMCDEESRKIATISNTGSRKIATTNNETVAKLRLSSTENDRKNATIESQKCDYQSQKCDHESQNCDYLVANLHTQIDSIDSIKIDSLYIKENPSDFPTDSANPIDGRVAPSEVHPSDAASQAKLEPKQKSKKTDNAKSKTKKKYLWKNGSQDRMEYLRTLDVDRLENIRLRLINEEEYSSICDMEDIDYCLCNESLGEVEIVLNEKRSNRKANNIVSLDCNEPALEKLSQCLGCSIEDIRSSVVRYNMNPEKLLACSDNGKEESYKYDYWNEKYSKSYDYGKWISILYEANKDNHIAEKYESKIENKIDDSILAEYGGDMDWLKEIA